MIASVQFFTWSSGETKLGGSPEPSSPKVSLDTASKVEKRMQKVMYGALPTSRHFIEDCGTEVSMCGEARPVS